MLAPLPQKPTGAFRLLVDVLHPQRAGQSLSPRLELPFQQLAAVADAHRVTPQLVACLLRMDADRLPADWLGATRRLRQAWTIHALKQGHDLKRAAMALAGAGITPLVLKGPAMARLAYDDPEERCATDLDLLVQREQHEPAVAALVAAGFENIKRYPFWFHYHDVLRSPSRTTLELHWALSRPDALHHISCREFLRRGLADDTSLPVLWCTPRDLLLHTADQSLREGFSRLQRVVDADRLIRRHGNVLDWEGLHQEARQGGLGPALWLTVALARQIFATPRYDGCESLRPPWISRFALESMAPGTALMSGFSLRYPITHRLYTVWLTQGISRQLRAAVRVVRRPTLRRHYQSTSLPLLPRMRRNLADAGKLVAYQGLCLVRHGLHRTPPPSL